MFDVSFPESLKIGHDLSNNTMIRILSSWQRLRHPPLRHIIQYIDSQFYANMIRRYAVL